MSLPAADRVPDLTDRPVSSSRGLFLVVALVASCAAQTAVHAQSISIQQPYVEVFGAATTIVVPDGGTGHLGSVSSARDSRFSSFAPGWGSQRFSERAHRSLTVTPYIMDLEEMDRAVLNRSATDPPLPFEEPLHESLRRFPSVDRSRHFSSSRTPLAPHSTSASGIPASPMFPVERSDSGTEKWKSGSWEVANDYQRRGEQAARAGQTVLANIYFDLAARNRPVTAAERSR